jgi:hypothetical protein
VLLVPALFAFVLLLSPPRTPYEDGPGCDQITLVAAVGTASDPDCGEEAEDVARWAGPVAIVTLGVAAGALVLSLRDRSRERAWRRARAAERRGPQPQMGFWTGSRSS